MSQLPLYHKNTKYKRSSSAGGSFKLSEAHLLMFLFLTFTLAWCVLVVYMPESQTSDTGFEATYQKFIHRSLESSPSEDIPAPPKILLPDDPQSNPVHVTTPTSKKTPETVKTPLTDSPTLSTSSTNREPDLGMSDQVTIKRREKVKEVQRSVYTCTLLRNYNFITIHMYMYMYLRKVSFIEGVHYMYMYMFST